MNDTRSLDRASLYKNVQAIKEIHSGFQGVPSGKELVGKRMTMKLTTEAEYICSFTCCPLRTHSG